MPVNGIGNPPPKYTPVSVSQWINDAIFTMEDGTVGAPGLAFSGEPTTGLFRPANGQVAVAATGVEALRVKSSGIDFNTGTYRADLQVTAQTVGSVVLTIPDMANVDQEVVLTAATQTLTNKTFSSATLASVILTGTPTAASAVWSDLGQVLTADIDGGTLDSVVIGGAAAANGTFDTLTWTTGVGSITESQISNLGTTVAMVADNLSVFAATTSSQLSGVINDETGSGSLVFATDPVLVSPRLGTPHSGVATNLTGTAASLTAGNVTTNADLTGMVTSSGNTASLGTFTKSNLSAAVSDGTPLYVGDITIYTNAEAIAAVEGEPTLVLQSGATVGGSPVVVDSDIGSTVQAYDATIVVDADIGSTVQAYDADLLALAGIGTAVQGDIIYSDSNGSWARLVEGTNGHVLTLAAGVPAWAAAAAGYTDGEAVAAVEAAGLSTPALGTPSALVGTNISGTAASLTAGNATLAAGVTTNANLTGHVTSTGNATILGTSAFTKAELTAAVSDGTPLYVGDTPAGISAGFVLAMAIAL
tara:strand:+ start:18393 stop:19991 length:1599 start_codon:yes stop_codon:yes gene_type:complete